MGGWGRGGERPAVRRAARLAGCAAALALAACSGGKKDGIDRPGLGRQVFAGQVRALKGSRDGAWLAFLDGCSEVRGAQALPPRTASCDLRVVAAGGGAPRKIAAAVTTLPYGFVWSPRADVLAALSEYDYVQGGGTLVVLRDGGEAARVADGVTFVAFAPADERVAAIAGGRLLAVSPGAPPEWFPGADGLTSFELHPSPADRARGELTALARRSAQGGGALLAVPAKGGAPAQVALRTGDYRFAPEGRAYAFTVLAANGYELRLATGGRPPARIARQVHGFEFSSDGAAIAFVSEVEPGQQGNLHVAPVGKPDALVGREVGEFRWAAQAPRLAWLEAYDPRTRAGILGVGGPGVPPRTFARNVSDFEVSPDGRNVAYLQHTTRGGYSVDLAAAHLDAPKGTPPEPVARGVFGFAYAPDGGWLYYRTRCTRNAEACDLERVPAAGLAKGAKPELLAQGVKSFEFDPRDPGRLLVTWQRMDMIALDVGVWERGKLTSVDAGVLPGTAQFLGPDSRRIAYAVAAPKRAGVYVAEPPR